MNNNPHLNRDYFIHHDMRNPTKQPGRLMESKEGMPGSWSWAEDLKVMNPETKDQKAPTSSAFDCDVPSLKLT